ncbi:D-alanyl-D-alanine carboxypeptidase family protein [Leuconostoc rapi]|uniref:D-alanyl-D-alanine carboxypeptidase family protein n=1 Tax=Leuconostoc rapi TaxID=1406906 RepID=UPI00195D4FFE|nr:serine hydrolase [Leuconostoc rapi]MBM7436250.1 D-alanyl-D-alanine carboxypeptidase (penicillin-binding protein 5/6) [Leuconostoc rapi]
MQHTKVIGAIFAMFFLMTTTVSANAVAKPLEIKQDVSSAIVIDASTGQILGEKNSDKLGPIASQSKLLTAYAVLKAIDSGKIKWSDNVRISKKADLSQQDSHMFSHLAVKAGDRLTVRELYNTMITLSANDSAFALAEYLTPKKMTTAQALQSWAEELQLTKSKWYNSAGQVNQDAFDNKVTSAPDDAVNLASPKHVAIIAREILRLDPDIRELATSTHVSYRLTKNYVVNEPTEMTKNWPYLINPNHLTIEGLKTGSTPESGAAFTGIIKDTSGHEFITVVNGAAGYMDEVQRYQKTLNIVNEVLADQQATTFTKGTVLPQAKQVELPRMKQPHMPVTVAQTKTIWVHKDSKLSSKMVAFNIKGKSVQKGQKIATLTFNLSGAKYLPNGHDFDNAVALVATQKTVKANFIVRTWRAIVHSY